MNGITSPHAFVHFKHCVTTTLMAYLLVTGHTRKISIPDCVEFHITTNACRGYCESWAVPSAIDTLRVNPHQAITSVGQCCNIMDTEDVSESLTLVDNTSCGSQSNCDFTLVNVHLRNK
jgi:hypothetical protein